MANLKKRSLFLLIIALLAVWAIPAASAASGPVISAKLSQQGSQTVLQVQGEQLEDVYAFEFQTAYQPKMVKFVSGKSDQAGFTVEPIIKDDTVLFAHTKTGAMKGVSGKASLATLTFEKLSEGDASFTIFSIKLVNSKLELIELSQQLTIRSGFIDITGHWAETAILKASEYGWVSGYTDGSFRPGNNITRAEFVTIIVRALGLKADANVELSFKDAQSIPAWSKGAVAAAVTAGLIEGYSDGTFQADKLVTRAEMTTIIVRSQKKPIDPHVKTEFRDDKDIPAWAKPYVAVAVEQGWVKGVGNNSFAPVKQATRAEATQLILNLNLR